MVSVMYFISAAKYTVLIEKKNNGIFQFIYFMASFWGQFGPNCTTFLLAGAPNKILDRSGFMHMHSSVYFFSRSFHAVSPVDANRAR